MYNWFTTFSDTDFVALFCISPQLVCHQILELSREEITGGFSGAELIAICREAALFALEDSGGGARIGRKHLLRSIESTKRQITPEMLDFYALYQKEAGASHS